MIRIVCAGIAVASLTLAGCTKDTGTDNKAPEIKTTDSKPVAPAASDIKGAVPAAVGSAVAAAQTLEVACAGCVYKMADAKGCTPAVKVAGKTYHAEIPGFNAHTAGLCSAPKQAQITGELKGDKFVASKIELK